MKAEVGYYRCAATDVSVYASRCFMPARRYDQSTIGEAMKIDE